MQFVRHELQSHGVEIRLDLASDLPDIEMDRVQIQQVLSNLIVNAIQAMAEHRTARPCITITSKPAADGRVCIEIADNGPGIAADDQERLFDSFFTTKAGGMGLGLPISRSIVEAHGGTIAFESGRKQARASRSRCRQRRVKALKRSRAHTNGWAWPSARTIVREAVASHAVSANTNRWRQHMGGILNIMTGANGRS